MNDYSIHLKQHTQQRIPKKYNGKEKITELYERIINKNLLTRRVNIAACNVVNKNKVKEQKIIKQLDLFSNEKIEEDIKEKEVNKYFY